MNFLANQILLKHIHSASDDNTHKGMDFYFYNHDLVLEPSYLKQNFLLFSFNYTSPLRRSIASICYNQKCQTSNFKAVPT